MSAGTRSCWTRNWNIWQARKLPGPERTAPSREHCNPNMDFRLSRHAEWEMTRRGIPLRLVETVMDDPEQRVQDESVGGRWIYQSRLLFEDGKMYLLRIVVAEDEQPPVVITAYRTSKVEKYWSA